MRAKWMAGSRKTSLFTHKSKIVCKIERKQWSKKEKEKDKDDATVC